MFEIDSSIPVEEIITHLKSNNQEILLETLALTGNQKLDEALNAVIALLKHRSEEVRSRAAWTLGKLEDPDSIPALVEALRDSSYDVRTNAGWALTYMGEQVVSDVITVLRDDSNPDAQDIAFRILRRIEGQQAEEAIEQYW